MSKGTEKEKSSGFGHPRPSRANKFTGKFNQTKKYKYICDEARQRLIYLIHTEQMNIKNAAEICDIPYENAKVINKVFIDEGRVKKMPNQVSSKPKASAKGQGKMVR